MVASASISFASSALWSAELVERESCRRAWRNSSMSRLFSSFRLDSWWGGRKRATDISVQKKCRTITAGRKLTLASNSLDAFFRNAISCCMLSILAWVFSALRLASSCQFLSKSSRLLRDSSNWSFWMVALDSSRSEIALECCFNKESNIRSTIARFCEGRKDLLACSAILSIPARAGSWCTFAGSRNLVRPNDVTCAGTREQNDIIWSLKPSGVWKDAGVENPADLMKSTAEADEWSELAWIRATWVNFLASSLVRLDASMAGWRTSFWMLIFLDDGICKRLYQKKEEIRGSRLTKDPVEWITSSAWSFHLWFHWVVPFRARESALGWRCPRPSSVSQHVVAGIMDGFLPFFWIEKQRVRELTSIFKAAITQVFQVLLQVGAPKPKWAKYEYRYR